jgi:hypothetical protein
MKNKCWQRCAEIEALTFCLWKCIVVLLLWKIVWLFLKMLNRITISPSNSTTRHTAKKRKYMSTQKFLHNYSSSIIHDNLKVKTIQISMLDKLTKQIELYTNNMQPSNQLGKTSKTLC